MTEATAERRPLWTKKLVLRAGSYQVAARILSLGTSLLALRVGLSVLDADEFGVWVTLSAVTTLLYLFDFGFGSGIVSQMAEAGALHDRERARVLVASAVTILSATAILLAVLGLMAHEALDGARLLGVHSASLAPPTRTALLITVLCVAAALVLGMSLRVLLALGHARAAGVWPGIGSLFQAAGLVWCMAARPSLAGFTLVYAATPLFGLLGAAVHVGRLLALGPVSILRCARIRVALGIARRGAAFFLLSAAAVIGYQTDSLVIANVLGPAAAGRYGVIARIVLVGPMLITLAAQPLWPAVASWRAEGRIGAVERALRHGSLVTIVTCGVWLALLIPILEPLLRSVFGERSGVPAGLVAALAALALVQAASAPLAFVLNGLSILRLQVVLALAMASTNIALSIIGAHVVGIAGPVWATVLTETTIITLPLWFVANHRIRLLAGSSSSEFSGSSRSGLMRSSTR